MSAAKYKVWHDGGSVDTISEYSPEAAVEYYARDYDDMEDGEERTVHVVGPDGVQKDFTLSAYVEWTYSVVPRA